MRNLLALALTLTALPAVAADPAPLNYADFEYAVPHVDLETCPDGLTDASVFCRATIANDAIHVFVFSEDGDQPMIGMTSFSTDHLGEALKD